MGPKPEHLSLGEQLTVPNDLLCEDRRWRGKTQRTISRRKGEDLPDGAGEGLKISPPVPYFLRAGAPQDAGVRVPSSSVDGKSGRVDRTNGDERPPTVVDGAEDHPLRLRVPFFSGFAPFPVEARRISPKPESVSDPPPRPSSKTHLSFLSSQSPPPHPYFPFLVADFSRAPQIRRPHRALRRVWTTDAQSGTVPLSPTPTLGLSPPPERGGRGSPIHSTSRGGFIADEHHVDVDVWRQAHERRWRTWQGRTGIPAAQRWGPGRRRSAKADWRGRGRQTKCKRWNLG